MPVSQRKDGRFVLHLGKAGQQETFMLGRVGAVANIRGGFIEAVYRKANGKLQLGWFDPILSICKAIARGEESYTLDTLAYPADLSVFVIEEVQKLVPIIRIVSSEPNKEAEGRAIWKAHIEQAASLLGSVASLGKVKLGKIETRGTFHEAFTTYIKLDTREHNWNGNELTQSGELRIKRVDRILDHHEDFPLSQLDYDKCKALCTYYANRPYVKGTTKHIAKETATKDIKELKRFFRWLDSTNKYNWTMPKGFVSTRFKVITLDAEKQLPIPVKKTYTLDEIKLMLRHATECERLILLVGLNCSFGASEMGRLTVRAIQENKIKTLRPKTQVYGEWKLWASTAEILDWATARAKRIGSDLICVSESGKPWYGDIHGHQRFNNILNRLVERIRKVHPSFPLLTYGKIRKTGATILRQHFGGEVASMALAHKHAFSGDALLNNYAGSPYDSLHSALGEIEKMLMS